MTVRLWAKLALTAFAFATMSVAASAQAAWPSRQPIKLVAVFPPGGSVDQVARILAVPLTIASVFVTKPHVDSKRLRPLAVTTSKRTAELPDVPTVAESGYPGFDAPAWWAVLAPAKTPPEIVKRMNEALNKALKSPEVAAHLGRQGITVIGGTPEGARTFINRQMDTWAAVVRENNIKAD